jgi:hypothetical protein
MLTQKLASFCVEMRKRRDFQGQAQPQGSRVYHRWAVCAAIAVDEQNFVSALRGHDRVEDERLPREAPSGRWQPRVYAANERGRLLAR